MENGLMTTNSNDAGWAAEVRTVPIDLELKGSTIISAVNSRQHDGYTYTDISSDTGYGEATIRRWLKEEKLETYTADRLLTLRSWVANRGVQLSDELGEFVNSTYVRHLHNADVIDFDGSSEVRYRVNTSMFPVLQAVGIRNNFSVRQTGVPDVPVWVRRVDRSMALNL